MTLAELLALLARWNELDDAERAELHEGMTAFVAESDDAEELEQVRSALLEATDAMLDAEQDDQTLEALTWTADVMDATRARITELETADADRAQRATELAERIRAEQGDGDDGEPGEGDGDGEGADAGDGEGAEGEGADGEAGDGDAGEAGDGEGAGDGEQAETREPVAADAAAGRRTPAQARRNRPDSAQRRQPAQARAHLVAAAGVPGVQMGARLDDPERLGRAFAETLAAMGNSPLRDGVRVPVATAEATWADEAFLDANPRGNMRKLDAVVTQQAITAAGGICAPRTPRYDLPTISTDDRPVRDGLTRFGADRGGVILPDVPTLAELSGAITVWTSANDADETPNPAAKACLRVDCGDDTPIDIDAVYQCLEFGNFNARTWPERVERFMQLAGAAHARIAESKMLTAIGAGSTAVTYGPILGSARDVLTGLDVLIAGTRSRHRMSVMQPFRMILPFWFRDQMRADLVRELPGSTQERLATANAEIDAFFAVRNVNITWSLDGETGQIFGAQGAGAVGGWPALAVGYLFPEGQWLFLDGGRLDFGLVRDSSLNSTNDFQMAMETFENVARYGAGESFRVSLSVCPDGTTSGTRDLDCPDSLAS